MQAAVVATFFSQGFLFASWTAHIPHVKDHLHLGDGSLGVALLGAPIGSMLAMLVVSRLIPRLGSRRVVRIGLVGYCLAGPLVGLTGSLLTFFMAFLLWGAFQGTLDVAMNAQAIAVEGTSGRRLMSGFHGSWSMGSLAGAAVGVLGVGLGWSLSEQLLIFAVPVLLVVGWLSTRMISDHHVDNPDEATERRKNRWTILQRAIVVLSAIAFVDMICEGAVADWAAVYLHGTLHASAVIAGVGYATYLFAMMATRLLGNTIMNRFPIERALPVLAAVAALGLGIGLIVNSEVSMLVGFLLLGAGLALVIPTVFSACGRIPNVHPGTAVATVSAVGWTGFVLGPPVIGGLATLTSLRTALLLVPILAAIVVLATIASSILRAE